MLAHRATSSRDAEHRQGQQERRERADQLTCGSRRGRTRLAASWAARPGHAALAGRVELLQDLIEPSRIARVLDDAVQERLIELFGHQIGAIKAEAIGAGQDLRCTFEMSSG